MLIIVFFLYKTDSFKAEGMIMSRKVEDYIGHKINRLTLLENLGTKISGNKSRRYVLARCECGSVKEIDFYKIVSNHTTSCGCFRLEKVTQMINGNITHGKSKTVEYMAWNEMKERCYNPKHSRYKYYGSKGVKVCDRWLHSFENFYADMKDKPFPDMSLDRIDGDKDYAPENCRWADIHTQNNNKSDNVFFTHKDKTQTVAQWAKEFYPLHNAGLTHNLTS